MFLQPLLPRLRLHEFLHFLLRRNLPLLFDREPKTLFSLSLPLALFLSHSSNISTDSNRPYDRSTDHQYRFVLWVLFRYAWQAFSMKTARFFHDDSTSYSTHVLVHRSCCETFIGLLAHRVLFLDEIFAT